MIEPSEIRFDPRMLDWAPGHQPLWRSLRCRFGRHRWVRWDGGWWCSRCLLVEDARITDDAERHAIVEPDCGMCGGTGWVCEDHPDRPWGPMDPAGCNCGAAGEPCPRST